MDVFDEEGNYIGKDKGNEVPVIMASDGMPLRSPDDFPKTKKCIKNYYISVIIVVIATAIICGGYFWMISLIGRIMDTYNRMDIYNLDRAMKLVTYGGFAVFVAAIIRIVGLYSGRTEHNGYRDAFTFCILGIGLSVIDTIINAVRGTDGLDFSYFSIASSICGYIALFLALKATSETMRRIGADDAAKFGDRVRTFMVPALAIDIVLSVYSTAGIPSDFRRSTAKMFEALKQSVSVLAVAFFIEIVVNVLLWIAYKKANDEFSRR
ncbi:MAG: hypothetical protein IKX54_02505 [Lachnospiraceae bacterium]|nr:hypothetical protein [Lachnospiraceae bacterium]